MPEEEKPMWTDVDVDEDKISWMICGVDRLNEILKIGQSKGGEIMPYKQQAENYKYYDKFISGAVNSYRKWTQKDDQLVLNHKILDRTISSIIKRSVKAI